MTFMISNWKKNLFLGLYQNISAFLITWKFGHICIHCELVITKSEQKLTYLV